MPRDETQDLLLHRHVERRRRLVGDDEPGLEREGGGDQHALAHAPRELVRIGGERARGVADVHFLEQLERPRAGVGAAHAGDEAHAVGELRLDPARR